MIDQLKQNYHSYLHDVKENFDPVIKLMREQHGRPWRSKAYLGPIMQFGKHSKQLKILGTLQWNSLPVIGPLIAGYSAGKFTHIPLWIIITAGIGLALILYYLLVQLYIGKMANINDPRFHVEAFKIKRRSEYDKIWAIFVEQQDFKFAALTEFVDAVFQASPTGDPSQVAIFAQGQIEEVQRAKQDLQVTISDQEDAIYMLRAEVMALEEAITYVVGLLKKVNENLYRFINDQFQLHDLDFVAGFSLYRIDGDFLKPIVNKGTSGSQFHPISLSEPGDMFAVVEAATSDKNIFVTHEPYDGRRIIAFRMKMLQNETWVWAFHFDHDDPRALSLIENNAIIDSRQIYRMIHSLCLLYHKQAIVNKEAGQHVGG